MSSDPAPRLAIRERSPLSTDLRIVVGGLWGFLRQLLRSARLRLFTARR